MSLKAYVLVPTNASHPPACVCMLLSILLPATGYTGNYAGHVGASLAFMGGLFDSPAASCYKVGMGSVVMSCGLLVLARRVLTRHCRLVR